MKKIIAVVVLFLLFAGSALLHAQYGGTGLGIMMGEPAGVSSKVWISGRSAIDAALGWSFYTAAIHLHTDYLWHNFTLFRLEEGKGKLPLYMGVGGRVKINHKDVLMGVRVPIGLAYVFPGDRFDVFVEAVPVLNLLPSTGFDFNAAVGLRYFFIREQGMKEGVSGQLF